MSERCSSPVRRKGESRPCMKRLGHWGMCVAALLAAMSETRRDESKEYAKLSKAFLEGRDRCEYPEGCHAASAEVHHRKGRVGPLYLDTDHWSALCSWHHRWVTEHPVEAVRLGISELRVGGAA